MWERQGTREHCTFSPNSQITRVAEHWHSLLTALLSLQTWQLQSQLRRPDVGKFSLAFGWQICDFISVKNLRLSVRLWAFPSHENLSWTSDNLQLVSQRKLNPFLCPTNHCRLLEGAPWRARGRSAKGTQIFVLEVEGERERERERQRERR